jgi:hypothetical protein
MAYGEALIDDDPDRIGTTTAVGLAETLFCRTGWASPSALGHLHR